MGLGLLYRFQLSAKGWALRLLGEISRLVETLCREGRARLRTARRRVARRGARLRL
jgi:hypothetical protein